MVARSHVRSPRPSASATGTAESQIRRQAVQRVRSRFVQDRTVRAMKTRTPILTSVVLVLALGACSPPGASTVPLPSVTVPSAPLPSIALPSVPLPSVDASAAASAAASLAAGAALAALDQVD